MKAIAPKIEAMAFSYLSIEIIVILEVKTSFIHGNAVPVIQLVDQGLLFHDRQSVTVENIDLAVILKSVPDLAVVLILDNAKYLQFAPIPIDGNEQGYVLNHRL